MLALYPLFHKIFQTFILLGYFLFSEGDLPFLAVRATYLVFFLSIIDIGLQLYFVFIIRNWAQQARLERLKQISVVQGMVMVVEVVVGSILLAVARRDSNILFSYPQFSLFSLLSIFYFAHTCYAVLPSLYIRINIAFSILANLNLS